MDNKQKRAEILYHAKVFFFELFQHKAKEYQKKKYSGFSINPFTVQATASAISTDINANAIAKAVVYPFVMGTSIATSFGTNVQKFIVQSLENESVLPSIVQGMDIEFVDATDGRKKYCQLKSGPNTINKDDIQTIEGHFKQLRNLAVTNHLQIQAGDSIVGVLYGRQSDLSIMYKKIAADGYPVYAGDDFWYHLTGIEHLYDDLIETAQIAAKEANWQQSVDELILRVEKGVEDNKDLYGID